VSNEQIYKGIKFRSPTLNDTISVTKRVFSGENDSYSIIGGVALTMLCCLDRQVSDIDYVVPERVYERIKARQEELGLRLIHENNEEKRAQFVSSEGVMVDLAYGEKVNNVRNERIVAKTVQHSVKTLGGETITLKLVDPSILFFMKYQAWIARGDINVPKHKDAMDNLAMTEILGSLDSLKRNSAFTDCLRDEGISWKQAERGVRLMLDIGSVTRNRKEILSKQDAYKKKIEEENVKVNMLSDVLTVMKKEHIGSKYATVDYVDGQLKQLKEERKHMEKMVRILSFNMDEIDRKDTNDLLHQLRRDQESQKAAVAVAKQVTKTE
jgi:hypothetical protein